MCHCWLHSPDDRPSFTDLTAELDKRLEERSSEVCFIKNLTSKAISSSMTQNKRQNKTSILSSYLGNYLCLVAYFWPQFQVIFAVILHRKLSKLSSSIHSLSYIPFTSLSDWRRLPWSWECRRWPRLKRANIWRWISGSRWKPHKTSRQPHFRTRKTRPAATPPYRRHWAGNLWARKPQGWRKTEIYSPGPTKGESCPTQGQRVGKSS